MIPFTHRKENGLAKLTVYMDSPVTVDSNDLRYKKILEVLAKKDSDENTLAEIKEILTKTNQKQEYLSKIADSGNKVEIKDNEVWLNGEVVHNSIAERILEFIEMDLPFKHLMLFLENVELNPSFQSRQEVFRFIENKDLPITEDGHFLAYKRVTDDYLDIYSKTIENRVGQTVKMSRRDVDDDRAKECSCGFHVGSFKGYVSNFHRNTGHVMVVKVHPKDVVSVPMHDEQKIRVCEYYVLDEMKEVFDVPLCGANAEELVEKETLDSNYKPNWTAIDERYEEEDYYDSYSEDEEYEEDENDYDDESDDFYLNPI